jgi:predicted TPR repeat methyltransferase
VIIDGWLSDTRDSHDTVADSYADLYRTALVERPYERAVPALFAELVETGGGGPVADVGCGPGHLTAHLRELDLDAFGVDPSPRTIDVARRTHIHRRTSDDVATLLRNAGFTVEARLVLDPVDQDAAGAGYLLARRGAGSA